MRTAITHAAVLLLCASPALASDVSATEARLEKEVGLTSAELDVMRYAVEHHATLGGEADDLVAASRAAVAVDCRGHCLVFVVEALNMGVRAEFPSNLQLAIVDRALLRMAARRDASPRCWTDVEQGAWMWVQVDAEVQRVLPMRDDPS